MTKVSVRRDYHKHDLRLYQLREARERSAAESRAEPFIKRNKYHSTLHRGLEVRLS
jgi:hypothetical protein